MRPSAGGDSEHVGTLAGTLGPRNEVRFCVDVLGARRIAHGVLAADDGTLIAHLANLKVCSEPGNSNTFTESHSESQPYSYVHSTAFSTSSHAGSGRGLDICPTSNQLLGTAGGPGLQSPLKQFLEAGVPRPQHSQSPAVAACATEVFFCADAVRWIAVLSSGSIVIAHTGGSQCRCRCRHLP